MYYLRDSYKWVVLGFSFLLMITFAISLQALPPLFDEISKDIPFNHSQAGMLMGAYAVPGIFLPFFVAYIARKFNEKHIILLALLTLIVGLIAFSFSTSFTLLFVFRLLAGIGATALVVLAPLLVTMFFQEENMGIAMGIFNAAVPSGTVIAANLFGFLSERIRWRSIILGITGFAALIFLLILFFLFLPKKDREEEAREEATSSFLGNSSLWFLAIIWALANGQLLSYVTFGPEFYQGLGLSVQRAGLLTSLIMLIPIFASPLVGILVDKTGWKRRLVLVGSIIMALSFFLMPGFTRVNPLWAATVGIGFSPIPVLVFALLPELVREEEVGMGLGVLTSASNLGIALGPAAFGFLLDTTSGNFNIGFVVLTIVSLGVLLSLWGLKIRKNLSK